MDTYYCVKQPGICEGQCDICPQRPFQTAFDFMNEPEAANVDPHKDDVNNPQHYTLGSIEVFDFIEAWELNFAEGNVIKYVVRAPFKETRVKDLKKARWYLDKLIEAAENE